MPDRARRARWAPAARQVLGGILLCCALVLVACAAPASPAAPAAPAADPQPAGASPAGGTTSGGATNQGVTAGATPVAIASAEQSAQQKAWEASAHARNYVALPSGDNNDCAPCHSPRNWMPTSAAQLPATCASCKFKISAPKPVPPAEWAGIGCDVCHPTSDKGVVKKDVAWLDAMVAVYGSGGDGAYQPVASTVELCEKCHNDRDTWHEQRVLGGPMKDFACTKCHEPHSTQASCTAEGCHAGTLTPANPIPGHDAAHAQVSCVACHDAGQMPVGPAEGTGVWVTLRAAEAKDGIHPEAYPSHNLQKPVDCARCHFTGNPWNLKVEGIAKQS